MAAAITTMEALQTVGQIIGTIIGVAAVVSIGNRVWRFFNEPRLNCSLYKFEPEAGSKDYFCLNVKKDSKVSINLHKAEVMSPSDAAFWHVGPGEKWPHLFAEDTNAALDIELSPGAELPVRFAVGDRTHTLEKMIIKVEWTKNQSKTGRRRSITIKRNKDQLAHMPTMK